MRVVLDTNVLVSAFVFPGGPPEAVFRQVLSGELAIIVSRPLLAELGRVLVGKFDWDPAYAEEVVAQLVRLGELVEPREVVDDIVDHPDDNARSRRRRRWSRSDRQRRSTRVGARFLARHPRREASGVAGR